MPELLPPPSQSHPVNQALHVGGVAAGLVALLFVAIHDVIPWVRNPFWSRMYAGCCIAPMWLIPGWVSRETAPYICTCVTSSANTELSFSFAFAIRMLLKSSVCPNNESPVASRVPVFVGACFIWRVIGEEVGHFMLERRIPAEFGYGPNLKWWCWGEACTAHEIFSGAYIESTLQQVVAAAVCCHVVALVKPWYVALRSYHYNIG